MGGEWGVGAALAFETLPAKGRGFFSGLLQEGYVVGNLMASLLYWFVFPHLHGTGMLTNWRVMFMIGALPAGLVLYIRSKVEESPAWVAQKVKNEKFDFAALRAHVPTFLFLVLLMTAFTSFSHGTQDLYPTFLEQGHGFTPARVGAIAFIANLGGLAGGIMFGGLSEKLGRRRAIIIASLLTLPLIPLWAWTATPMVLALGGFLMQFMVQGAWGVIPAHLNELSPGQVRDTMPGFTYQLGSLLSARNGVFQTALGARYFGGSLKVVMSVTVVVIALAVSGLTGLGRERKGVDLRSS